MNVVPQSIDTPRMASKLVHNVQISDPILVTIYCLYTGVPRPCTELSPQEPVVDLVLHGSVSTTNAVWLWYLDIKSNLVTVAGAWYLVHVIRPRQRPCGVSSQGEAMRSFQPIYLYETPHAVSKVWGM